MKWPAVNVEAGTLLSLSCDHTYAHDWCSFSLVVPGLCLVGNITNGRTQKVGLHLLSPCCHAAVHHRREPTLSRCAECLKVYPRPAYRESILWLHTRRGTEVTSGPTSTRMSESPVELLEYWCEWRGLDPLASSVAANHVWAMLRDELGAKSAA